MRDLELGQKGGALAQEPKPAGLVELRIPAQILLVNTDGKVVKVPVKVAEPDETCHNYGLVLPARYRFEGE